MPVKKPAKQPYVSRLDKLKMPTHAEDIDPRAPKRGPGRPRFASEKRLPRQITLGKDMMDSLEREALKARLTCSVLIERALTSYFETRKELPKKK